MSASANKKLMQDIFAAAASPDPAVRDRALFAASLADDAKWIVTGQYSWSRTFTGKEAIMNDLHGYVRTRLRDRTRTVAERFIADGDIVVVEAKGDNITPEGVRYDNDYCLVFRLEDGKIKEIREYCEFGPDREGAGAFPGAGPARRCGVVRANARQPAGTSESRRRYLRSGAIALPATRVLGISCWLGLWTFQLMWGTAFPDFAND